MQPHLFLAAVLCTTIAAEDVFTVLRTTPMDEQHLQLLNLLFKEGHKQNLDFWKSPTGIGYTVDIMSTKDKIDELQGLFNSLEMPNNRTIEDVQKLILDREVNVKHRKDGLGSFGKRMRDEAGVANKAKYQFGEYHGYGEIVRWLNEIAQEYPQYARVLSIGTTFEGRNIICIKIGTNTSRTDKKVVWIDGGIHAREWGAIHTALHFIEQLIVGYENNDPVTRSWVDSLNFYIVPVLNPDGFEYTRSDVTPMKRLWRKNRAGITCNKDQWFRDRCCGGIDLNRNFDFHWGGSGSSDDPCSEIFQGTSAFSEMESQAVRNMMLGAELSGKVQAFITLHTYSQMWIHPYSHARKSVPEDIAELKSVGARAVAALEGVYGTKYRFGTGADILYPSSGGSDDWAKAKGGAKYVYLIELRPGEEVWDGFVLDARQLIPMGKETWEGIKVVIGAVYSTEQSNLQRDQITQAQIAQRTRPGRPVKHRGHAIIGRRPKHRVRRPKERRRVKIVRSGRVEESLSSARSVLHRPTHRLRSQPIRPPIARIITQRPIVSETTAQPVQQPAQQVEQPRRPVQQPQQQQQLSQNTRPVQPVQLTQQQQQAVFQQRQQQNFQQQQQSRFLQPAQPQQQPQQQQCRDTSPWCRAWLRQNADVCRVSSIYMSRECRFTCRFC
ncbi:hypothetical protein PENTCL1PPCAC_21911 [Pristionchus entomophagus]|uniref:ShKT domain-containing protein n=1 Tax=Pristionchus entomophagus TaxID=358040 RepID=A0AAV5TZ29_9BILA|nr:hypothetical protein PENTCL1PPCAC_21911 [Pristionchus entomophagus]